MPASRKLPITALCLLVGTASPVIGQTAWELVKDKDGIQVSTRDVPGSTVKEFKATTTIQASLDSLMAVLDDTKACPRWLYKCKAPRILKRNSFTERYTYQVSALPWPTKSRDLILHAQISQDAQTKAVTIRLTAAPDYLPKSKEYVRIRKSNGYYLFEPQSEGDVRVTWQQHTEPGGRLPSWLTNALLVDLPFKSLQNLRKLVREERYQQAKLQYSAAGTAEAFAVKTW